ncbi:Fungalysin/Thermolysin Extracellular metalloproteinase 5 [Blyttiomyces sp. JEL0837]|nr:Fungalysin/Thermolysin Extracellular metalloproteinase 5 [Blyttiomyces sp. JEL0837]
MLPIIALTTLAALCGNQLLVTAHSFLPSSDSNSHVHRKATAAVPDFYMPQASTMVNWRMKPSKLDMPTQMDPIMTAAQTFLGHMLGMDGSSDMAMSSFLTVGTGNLQQVHVVQMINNVPIVNAVASALVDSQGSVMAASHSMAPMPMVNQFMADNPLIHTVMNAPAAAINNLITNVQNDVNAVAANVNANTKAAAPKKAGKKGRRAADTTITVVDAITAFASTMGLPGANNLHNMLTVSPDPQGSLPTSVVITGAPFAEKPIMASLKYYQTSQNTLVHVWDLNIDMLTAWNNVFVDATTGDIVGMSDWVSHAKANQQQQHQHKRNIERRVTPLPDVKYRVIPFGTTDLMQNGGGLSLVSNPWDLNASPFGWHDANDNNGNIGSTFGNNVVSMSNTANNANPLMNFRPVPDNPFNFDFVPNLQVNAENDTMTMNAAVVNAFYISNMIHDLFYMYGFTEADGNFQISNTKLLANGSVAGLGGDPVVVTTEDGSGTNNANFASPGDGQAGRMRMFIFDGTKPHKDGALENDILIHELTHGLSSRLTGGPMNANCLATQIAQGLGEGWSDIVAVMLHMAPGDTRNTDKAVGVYVANTANGVRKFLYSTDTTRNPQTYNTLNQADTQEVHRIGEVWATFLFELYWNMVDRLGSVPPAQVKDSVNSGKGNTDFLALLIEGMKQQPCNPTFIQARDALFLADMVMFNGRNNCDLWRAFGKRGLGFSAVDDKNFVDATDVPAVCMDINVTAGGVMPPTQNVGGAAANNGTMVVKGKF